MTRSYSFLWLFDFTMISLYYSAVAQHVLITARDAWPSAIGEDVGCSWFASRSAEMEASNGPWFRGVSWRRLGVLEGLIWWLWCCYTDLCNTIYLKSKGMRLYSCGSYKGRWQRDLGCPRLPWPSNLVAFTPSVDPWIHLSNDLQPFLKITS